MLNSIFKKWWVILIQGILMVLLGFYIFKNPKEVIAGISIWFGLIIMIIGIVGIIGWIISSSEERSLGSLFWSFVTALFGLLVLMNLFAAMKVVTVIFGIWVVLTGINLLSSGWSIRKNNFMGWLLVIVGILSVIAGFMMIFNMGLGAEGVATILGLQVLLTGIGLILLSFVRKMISGKVKEIVNK